MSSNHSNPRSCKIRTAAAALALSAGFVLAMIPSTIQAGGFGAYTGSVGSLTNDAFSDGRDRWQTGSYQRSFLFERDGGDDALMFELRGRAQIISPWAGAFEPGGDRPYSSVLGIGLFAHRAIGSFEARLGGEVLVQGDQTGLPEFQAMVHDVLGFEEAYDPTSDDLHLSDRVTGRGSVEISRSFVLGEKVMLRPYGALVVGADEAATVGVDLVIGNMALPRRWVRDAVTGQILSPDTSSGFSLLAGIDGSYVRSSIHLPDEGGVRPEDIQTRIRLGVQGTIGPASVFFGQTWLSEEFVGQAEPQRIGTLSVSFAF